MLGRRLLTLYTSTVLICQVYGVITPFLPIIADEKLVEEWKIGVIFSTMPFGLLLSTPFIGTWMYKLGRRNTLCLAFLASVLSTQTLAMALAGCSTWMTKDQFFVANAVSRALSGVANGCNFTVCKE
jgi:MFS family permease